MKGLGCRIARRRGCEGAISNEIAGLNSSVKQGRAGATSAEGVAALKRRGLRAETVHPRGFGYQRHERHETETRERNDGNG